MDIGVWVRVEGMYLVVECGGRVGRVRVNRFMSRGCYGGLEYLRSLVSAWGFRDECYSAVMKKLLYKLNDLCLNKTDTARLKEGGRVGLRKNRERKIWIRVNRLAESLNERMRRLRYRSDDFVKVAKALALRIDPYTAYNIYVEVFGALKREELIDNINWLELCKAWKTFDEFRDTGNLALLSLAYRMLKTVPELYGILALWIMNEREDKYGIVEDLWECLIECVENKMAPNVIRCLDDILSSIGLGTRRKYLDYEECRRHAI